MPAIAEVPIINSIPQGYTPDFLPGPSFAAMTVGVADYHEQNYGTVAWDEPSAGRHAYIEEPVYDTMPPQPAMRPYAVYRRPAATATVAAENYAVPPDYAQHGWLPADYAAAEAIEDAASVADTQHAVNGYDDGSQPGKRWSESGLVYTIVKPRLKEDELATHRLETSEPDHQIVRHRRQGWLGRKFGRLMLATAIVTPALITATTYSAR